jgi:hypothetical protein
MIIKEEEVEELQEALTLADDYKRSTLN